MSSFLITSDGQSPFPGGERWKAQAAHMTWSALNQLSGGGGLKPTAKAVIDNLGRLPQREWVERLASPEVFAWCTETQKKGAAGEENWAELAAEMAYDPGRVPITDDA